MMNRWLCLLFLLGCTSRAYGTSDYVFEKGDLLFRPKTTDVFDVEHVAIYLNGNAVYIRFTVADAANNNLPNIDASDGLHSVIHEPGYGSYFDPGSGETHSGAMITTLAGMLSTRAADYRGSFENPLMDAYRRHQVILEAGKLLGAPYTFHFGWEGGPTPWNPAGMHFRCDGFARYVYAQVEFPFDESSSSLFPTFLMNSPKDLRRRLGNAAGARAPLCGGPIFVSGSGNNFTLSVSNVKDDAFGSGIDRVEFYSGYPTSLIKPLGTDDHDSNPAAFNGDDCTAQPSRCNTTYQVTGLTSDPGTTPYTMVYDQSGNWAICDVAGNVAATSDLVQTARTPPTDTPPKISDLTSQMDPNGQTATVSWSGPSQTQYAYSVDVPFEQWDDPNVTILGSQTSVSVNLPSTTSGLHAFYLVASDPNGNIAYSSFTFSPGPSLSMQPGMDGGISQGGLLMTSLVWSAAYSDFSGAFNGLGDASQDVPVVVPYLQGPTMAFSLNDGDLQASPVASVTAADPAGNAVSVTRKALCGDGTDAGAPPYCGACAQHGGGPQVSGSFPTPLAAPGQYTLTATDCAGAQTVAPVVVAPMSVSTDVASSLATFDSTTGAFV